MTYGLYLCKVKGMRFCDHIVLKYNEDGWWRYFQDYVHQYEGWVGNDLEIIGEPKLIKNHGGIIMKGFITVSDGVSDHLISTAHIVAVNGKEIVLEGGIAILTDEDFETICEKIRLNTETQSADAEYLRSGLEDIWELLEDKL